jgi:hypothetical protein
MSKARNEAITLIDDPLRGPLAPMEPGPAPAGDGVTCNGRSGRG